MNIKELDMLDEVLATDPEPPRLGDCRVCDCEHFQLKPPMLPATQFLGEVSRAARRGASGREMRVVEMADGTHCFNKQTSAICLRIRPDGNIVMDVGTSSLEPRVFTMGQDTVGATVIAIHDALKLLGSR